jgi:iron complex outermembrane receptor protein
MSLKKILFRLFAFTIFMAAGFSSDGQNLSDTIMKPVYKTLDSVEVLPKENPGFIKTVSSSGTKTPTPVMDIPQTISSVTRQFMDDKMDFTLKESVTDLANVNAYSGYEEYSIRGFLAENPRSINGLRGYNTRFNSILLLNIESIDVLKGPAAVLYGNTDPGGTVNLVTKKPLSVPSGQIGLFGGSWDHFRAQGDFTGPANESKTILYRLNAGYDQTHGFIDQFYSKAFQLAPSFSFIPNKNLLVNLDFSLSTINTTLNRGQPGLENDNNLYATPISLSVTQPGDYLKETDLSTMISIAWKISPQWSFHTAYLNYITRQDVAEHGLASYINYDSINLYFQKWNFNSSTNSWTNYFNYRFHWGETVHDAMLGYDYIASEGEIIQTHYENPDVFGTGSGIVGTFNLLHPQYNQKPAGSYSVSTNGSGNIESDNYYTQGIYLQDQVSYKNLNLLLGIRREFYRTDTDEEPADSTATVENVWLPRIGLVYGITPMFHVYGVYSKGFDPYEISNTFAVFNEPFKPVNSELFELGFKAMFLKGKLYGTLSFYQLSIFNVAVNANNPANPDLYTQRGEDQARGFEMELNGNILPNFQVHFAYAYNVAKVKKSELPGEAGMIKENAPVNSSNGFFKYDFIKGFLKGFSLNGGYNLVDKRNTLDKEIELPGYFTMQVGFSYQWHPFILSFQLNNIGNEIYWSGAYNNVYKWPGAGRNFLIKMNWDLQLNKSGNTKNKL